jgi:hypothetical protein
MVEAGILLGVDMNRYPFFLIADPGILTRQNCRDWHARYLLTVNLQIIARYPKHQRGTCRYPCFENCEVSFGKARFSNEFFGSEATSQ